MLRYLKIKPLSLYKTPWFGISDYFGPSNKKSLDLPLLDEGAFPHLYSSEKRLQELLHDNEIVKNPKKYRTQMILQKKQKHHLFFVLCRKKLQKIYLIQISA